MVNDDLNIGLIGAGRMATALARGLAAGCTRADNILAYDPEAAARTQFEQQTGGHTVESPATVFGESTVVFLAVKPQHMKAVLASAAQSANAGHLIISIAAGVTLQRLLQALGEDARVARVMPNTPCLRHWRRGDGRRRATGGADAGNCRRRL